jgi:hypothetical protein
MALEPPATPTYRSYTLALGVERYRKVTQMQGYKIAAQLPCIQPHRGTEPREFNEYISTASSPYDQETKVLVMDELSLEIKNNF